MTKSHKIDLENGIFYRAAVLRVQVWARAGALHCSAPDAYLRRLIHVYNTFFSEENREPEEPRVWDDFWKAYIRGGSMWCGLCGPIYPADLMLELLWAERVGNKSFPGEC